MRRKKHLEPASCTHWIPVPKNLPVDPLKLEPPFRMPDCGPPIPWRTCRRRGKGSPKAEKSHRRLLEKETKSDAIAKAGEPETALAKSGEKESQVAEAETRPTDISEYKAKINRTLGPGKWHGSAYGKLLRQSVSQDETVQKVLPLVMQAATDISVTDQERREAADAILEFAMASKDDYDAVRASCEDKSDRLTHALAEIVLFTNGVDDGLHQRACEVLSRVAEINRLEAELEAKKQEMRDLAKDRDRAVKTAVVGSLTAAPIIELIAPGLVAQILPFYLAYLAIVGAIGWRMKAGASMRNLTEQRQLEQCRDSAREELRDSAPMNLLTEHNL